MVKVNHYKSIALPGDLIGRIDAVINKRKLGYTSRSEFVKEAVRLLLRQVT